MKEKNNGITLIALIITIIVLLILAGVSISLVVGENGILSRATDASEKTNEAKDEEQRQFAMAEAAMNFENTEYEDKNGEKVTIPAGFAVSQVEGENTVEDGLVIIDSKGNEFVWIPCNLTGKDDLTKYEKHNYLGMGLKDTGSSDYVSPENWTSWYYRAFGEEGWEDSAASEYGNESVSKYKGFYVGRYEAGISDEASFYPDEENEYKYIFEDRNTNDIAPVTKKNEPCWTCISQSNAKLVSEKMYETNNSVQSKLIDNYAWDTIVNWINSDEIIGNFYNSSETLSGKYIEHSLTSDGNLVFGEKYKSGIVSLPNKKGDKRIELYTGTFEKDKYKNIYDMSGNVAEMTTEIGINRNGDSREWCSMRGYTFESSPNLTTPPLKHKEGYVSSECRGKCRFPRGSLFRLIF